MSITALVFSRDPQAQQQTDCTSLSAGKLAEKAREAEKKGDWFEAERLYKCSLAKKKDQKIQKALDAVQVKIADQQALEAEKSLKAEDFKACNERLLDLNAKRYPQTSQVARVQKDYDTRVAEIRKQFDAAMKQARGTDPEGAVRQLKNLSKYAYVLNNLDASIRTATDLQIEKMLAEADNLMADYRFEEASAGYVRVLAISSDNKRAAAGRDRAYQGNKAAAAFSAAQDLYQKKQYEKAQLSADEALTIYPDGKDRFEPLRKKIVNDWLNTLLEKIGTKPEEETDFDKILDIYLSLLHVRDLDKSNPVLAKFPDVRTNLARASAMKAKTGFWSSYEAAPASPDRIATAYALMLNGRLSGAEDIAQEGDLDSLATLFYRKRSTRLILSIENVAGAEEAYVQRIQNRCKNIAESLQLQDLGLFERQSYEAQKKDLDFKNRQPIDYRVLFDDNMKIRPNNRSSYILLKVVVDQIVKKEKQVVRTDDIQSQYVAGTADVPNPKYKELQEKYKRAQLFFMQPKNRNKIFEDWDYVHFTAAQQQLDQNSVTRIPEYLKEEDVKSYQFQQLQYVQNAAIKLNIRLMDDISKDEVLVPGISGDIEEQISRKDSEIVGVKEKDKKGNQNKPLLWPVVASDLEEVKNKIDAILNARLPLLLKPYLDRFYVSGKRALDEGRLDDAAEDFLCHWAFYRGKMDPEQSSLIARTVLERTGFELNTAGAELVKRLIAK